MKTIANVFITSKAGHLGFATVCTLLLTAGVYAKVAVDRFDDQQDRICDGLNGPSQFYLWSEAQRQKQGANVFPASKETRVIPGKPAANGPVLP